MWDMRMPPAIHPRRSVLFMPGSNGRALERAKTLPADALIFDLEDAVAPDAKETARQMVYDAVRGGGYGQRELIVRVNSLASAWGEPISPPSPVVASTPSCCPRSKAATWCGMF